MEERGGAGPLAERRDSVPGEQNGEIIAPRGPAHNRCNFPSSSYGQSVGLRRIFQEGTRSSSRGVSGEPLKLAIRHSDRTRCDYEVCVWVDPGTVSVVFPPSGLAVTFP